MTQIFFIQGSACCSKTQAVVGYAGIIYDSGSAKTIPSPGAVFVWMFYAATSTLASEAAGGFRVIIGSATTAFRHWYVRGVDTYAYGGWICVPVDPTVAGDTNTGTPNMASLRYFGTIAYVPGPGYAQRGNPHGLDAMRYGRGESRIANGSTADGYATFLGYATTNDSQSNRWGLIQAVAPGVHSAGYLVQGLVIFGYGAATDFRDSNTTIVINDTKKVVSSFNSFEVRNALSRVDLTAISFTALGTTSRGNWITTDNADVNIDACSFTDMGTFTLLSATAIINSTLRSCDTITAPGSDLRGTSVLTSRVAADAGAVVWNVATDPDGLLDGMTFSKGTNAHHAITFGTSVSSAITLRNIEFTGFTATQDNNAAALQFLNTTGGFNVNLIGCTVGGAPATSSNLQRDDAACATDVTLVFDPVTTLINIKDPDGNNEAGVNVYLAAASVVSGGLPFEQSITSITRSGTTATVTFGSAHGLNTGEYLKLYGITNVNRQEDLSGAFQVTVTSPTVLTYQTTNSGDTSYTGTLTGTGVTIYGTTDDPGGNISSSRTYGADINYSIITTIRSMQTIPFIIVQASGRGKRMQHLTNNRPKALISLFAEPLLLKLMSLYNDSHFIILGSYQFTVLKTYLSKYASNKNYTLIKTAGATIGSNAGIKTALSGIPANTPFMILWCDLLHQKPINFSIFDIHNKNYLGLSDSFVCRWRYKNGLLEEKSSRKEGVAGIYIFAKKNILKNVPATGEFCEFLQKKQIKFTPFIAKDIQEVGTLSRFSKIINTRPVTRSFNLLEVGKKTVTKFPTNQQGIDLAKDESNWHNMFKDKHLSFLPRIYSLSPLTLQKIDGTALYLTKLTLSEKEKVLKQIIKNLKTIHTTFSPKTKEYTKNNYEAYLAKTKRRLDSVASLIPHIEKDYLVINNQRCLNFYKFWPKIEELIKPYFTNIYVPIHGDCTFSNILYEPLRKKVYFIDPRGYFGQEKIWGDPDYDWAKLYYSLVGNYDQFNHKNFKLLIGKDKINLSIKTNGYSQLVPLFFKLTETNSTKINLLHAIIWLSLSAYSWDDYDAICGAFYNGIYLLNQQ